MTPQEQTEKLMELMEDIVLREVERQQAEAIERPAREERSRAKERNIMRFTAACHAMQGILGECWHPEMGWYPGHDSDAVAKNAVRFADALLAELAATPDPAGDREKETSNAD